MNKILNFALCVLAGVAFTLLCQQWHQQHAAVPVPAPLVPVAVIPSTLPPVGPPAAIAAVPGTLPPVDDVGYMTPTEMAAYARGVTLAQIAETRRAAALPNTTKWSQ